MDLITICIYENQTYMHIISAYVNVSVMRLCVCEPEFRFNYKVSMNVSCFPQ